MKFLKKDKIAIGAIAIACIAGVLAFQSNRVSNETRKNFDALATFSEERFLTLDSELDKKEREILSLRKDGYVEADDFSSFAEQILQATVILGNDGGEQVGSGFFIDSKGILATAAHVADALGENAVILLSDGKRIQAHRIAKNDAYDIALYQAKGNNFSAVTFGYFENIEIGEEVGIVGFSKGFSDILVHRGVISSKQNKDGVKQLSINAFINKGNSGGPVFSALTGRVIGIVSARQTDVPVEKLIQLPPNYSSGFAIGGIDPVKFNVDLYNETVKIVGDVSQVGIGFVSASDHISALLGKIRR